MKRIGWLASVFALAGCALTGRGSDRVAPEVQIWTDAHQALAALQFGRADTLFTRLAREHPDTGPGRESLFFLGAVRIDPRNPGWDPARSEEALSRYLAIDTTGTVAIGRRPEGETLFEIARQLNLPPEDRVPGLQPETRVVTRTVPQRVAPAGRVSELSAENARLREQLTARDAQIRRLEEELERIRRTLSTPGR